MSTVLLITADDQIRQQVQLCARRSGMHLTVHTGIRAARPVWKDAGLVLLGGDQAHATTGHLPLPDPKPWAIVTTGGEDSAPWEHAADLGASYVVVLPMGQQWLTGRLDDLPGHPVTVLKKAGFHVGYADPAEVARHDSLAGWEVRPYAYGDADCPYVALDDIARSECAFGQSSTVTRSNHRTLPAAFPGVFSTVHYSNVQALGAFVADLTPELAGTLIGLKEQYPLFDEHDHAVLEEEDITEWWSRYVKDQIWDRLAEHVKDVWIAMPPEQVEDLWWQVVNGLGYRPEHDGRDVQWDLDQLAAPFAARLMAEFRRTFRAHPIFKILTRVPDRGDRPGPRFAVAVDGFPILFALAWSRFSAKAQLWQHQHAWLATVREHRRTAVAP